ncbi:MAG: glycosyltransferase family 4 protein [Candidatus Omnitrophica bacterium]|nr:glycosyltransferase family 4 protein [Candidatus Omnitrophota bacterium]
MRIGFDARVLTGEKCGTANYLCRLVQQLVKLRPHIEVFLFAPEKICVDYEPFLNHPQVHRVVLELKKSRRKHWPAWYIPKLLKQNRIDVFHQPFNADGPVFLPPCPTVVTILDLIPWVVKGLFTSRFKELRYKVRNLLWTRIARKVVTISECSKKDIVRLCHISDKQVMAAHLGADDIYEGPITPEEEREILDKYHLLDKRYVVNMSGLNQKRRHPDFILEGFAQFRRHVAADVYLVFTGSIMKYEGFYERVLRKMDMLGIRGRVIMTGFIPDKALKVILSHAEISVVTSLYEGFCLPVTESFACGVPVIANGRGSIPEIAQDAAVLIDPYDPDGLSEALRKLWDDPEQRRALIEKGYERNKSFSWEKMAMETLAVYQSVVGKIT